MPAPVEWAAYLDVYRDMRSRLSRPSEDTEFLEGWKAEQVRPSSWPSFAACHGAYGFGQPKDLEKIFSTLVQ